MLKKSLFNVSVVSLGNIFNSVLGFVFLATVAKVLSVETFGRYALITSLLVAIAKMIDFGTNSVFVANSIRDETTNSTNAFISLKIILLALTLPISAIALHLLGLFNTTNFILFSIGLFGYGINQTLYAFFQKSEQFAMTFLINTVPGVIKSFVGILAVLNFVTISFDLALAVFTGSIITSVLFYPFVSTDYREFKLSFLGTRKLIKSSVSAGISQLIGVGWSAIANSMLSLSRTLTDVGIYSLANKIANIFSLISLSVFTVLLPANAKRVRDKVGYDFKETAIISILILTMSLLALILGKTFIQVFFGEKYAGSLPILNILIISYSFNAISSFVSNYFYISENTNALLAVTLITLGVFITSGLILIPLYATQGLAISHLISSCVGLLIPFPIIYSAEKKLRLSKVDFPISSE